MGSAGTYICENCGYTADCVTADFDCGFSADVTTPIACPKDGIKQVETGLRACDEGWRKQRRESYECPVCHEERPLWDRKTCPLCGEPTMNDDPSTGGIMWD